MAEETKIENFNYKEALAKRTELLMSADAFYKEIGDENPTKEQVEQVSAWNKDIEICEHIIAESKDFRDMKERVERAAQEARGQNTGQPPMPGTMTGMALKTLGERFANRAEYQSWIVKVAGGADRQVADSAQIGQDCPPLAFERKDLITGGGLNTGGMVAPDFKPLVSLPFVPLMLRDIITVGTTQSDTVEYPRILGYTNRAKAVAEATATANASGVKPESAMSLEKAVSVVKTIAHWLPVTKRALSDAGQIRTIVDGFLLNGLDQAVEDDLLNGDGSGDHLLGLTNTPNIQHQAFDTDVLVTARKARTKAEVTGLVSPTAYLLSPYDWQDIELTKSSQGIYYYGGPQVLGNPRLWGLPVVTSIKQPTGAGYCADFKQVVVWDREQSNIRVSDGYADFFVRNMVAILAELRLANGVFRPQGVVEMDLFAGKNS